MPPTSKADPQDDAERTSGLSATSSDRDRTSSTAAPDWMRVGDDEDLLWTGRPSLWPVTPTIMIGVVVSLLGVMATLLTISPVELLPFASLPIGMQLPATLPLVLVPIGFLIAGRPFVHRWRVRYVITSAQISKQVGLLARDTTRLRFDHIQNTVSNQSLAGRLLSYGDIGIATAGTSATELVFEDVRHPGRVNSILARQLDGTAADPLNGTPPRR